jgi:hypothetical protein
MPTVRLRAAAEYPPAAQKLFELSRSWFNHDFAEPPAAQRQLHLRVVLPQEGMLPGYAASPRTILTREAWLRV